MTVSKFFIITDYMSLWEITVYYYAPYLPEFEEEGFLLYH